MRKAILSIHGIGQQKDGFAEDFHKRLLKEFDDSDEIRCFEFSWQHLLGEQEGYLKQSLHGLKWRLTRRFVIEYIGDAVSYAKDSVFYLNAHKGLDEKLLQIEEWLGDGELYIIAHSLGTVIAFDYIYNMQNPSASANKIFHATAVKSVNCLKGLITLGSPLFVYSLQKYDGGRPIVLDKWINIYSPFDVIGYPVKNINTYYKNSKHIQDKSMICGGLFSFWNPISHNFYFDSKRIIRYIGEMVKDK
jgi:hypothetical protein